MFCGNCGAPLNSNEKFCGNCGAKQNNVQVQNNTLIQKKTNPVVYIVPIVIAIVVIITAIAIISGVFHAIGSNSNSSSSIYGAWKCSDDTTIKLNKDKTFEMYDSHDKDELYVKGKYSIDEKIKDTNKANVVKYRLTLTTSYRVIDGETYDGLFSNKYEMALSTYNSDEMVMINEKTYNMYYCSK